MKVIAFILVLIMVVIIVECNIERQHQYYKVTQHLPNKDVIYYADYVSVHNGTTNIFLDEGYKQITGNVEVDIIKGDKP